MEYENEHKVKQSIILKARSWPIWRFSQVLARKD